MFRFANRDYHVWQDLAKNFGKLSLAGIFVTGTLFFSNAFADDDFSGRWAERLSPRQQDVLRDWLENGRSGDRLSREQRNAIRDALRRADRDDRDWDDRYDRRDRRYHGRAADAAVFASLPPGIQKKVLNGGKIPPGHLKKIRAGKGDYRNTAYYDPRYDEDYDYNGQVLPTGGLGQAIRDALGL